MPSLHHRDPGPVLVLLEHPDVTVEVIADGAHLHPAMVRTVVRTAGQDRIALITDAIAAAGCADGTYWLSSVPIEMESGVAG